MRYGVTTKDSISKLRPRKAGESSKEITAKERYRPFTDLSDLLVIQFMEEDDYDLIRIAREIGRDYNTLSEHIEEIRQSGRYDKLKKHLEETSIPHRRKMEIKKCKTHHMFQMSVEQ